MCPKCSTPSSISFPKFISCLCAREGKEENNHISLPELNRNFSCGLKKYEQRGKGETLLRKDFLPMRVFSWHLFTGKRLSAASAPPTSATTFIEGGGKALLFLPPPSFYQFLSSLRYLILFTIHPPPPPSSCSQPRTDEWITGEPISLSTPILPPPPFPPLFYQPHLGNDNTSFFLTHIDSPRSHLRGEGGGEGGALKVPSKCLKKVRMECLGGGIWRIDASLEELKWRRKKRRT